MTKEQVMAMRVTDLLGEAVTYRHPSHPNIRKGVITGIYSEYLVVLGRKGVTRTVDIKNVWMVQ